jgi:hypothetical protein
VRVALWTPAPEAAWVRSLAARLGSGLELAVVSAEPPERPPVEIDLYHVAGAPAYGFVYRALLGRPGIVLLAEWNLHALVHAETAGRGDADAYRREARRGHGDTGAFVARQVLAGLGGALPALVAMNQRVLDASLALVAFDADLARRAGERLAGRRVLHVPLDRPGAADEPAALAQALRTLLLELGPRAEPERRKLAARDTREGTLAGSALAELRWTARELGIAELPADIEPLVAALFRGAR